DVAATVPVAVHDDPDTARDLVRPWIAFYLGAMGAPTKNFYVDLAERYGEGESARACQSAMLSGDRVGSASALSKRLIDLATIACRPGELPERLAAYADAGVTTLVAIPS